MRAGRLKEPATLHGSEGGAIGSVQLVGLEDKDGSISFSEGLKSNAKITIRSRWQETISPGNFWHVGNRIFLINGVSNPDGSQRDAVCSCTEFVGAMATVSITDENNQPATLNVKCALTRYRTKPQGEHDYLSANVETERRTAEFISSQYWPVIGHEFTLAGAQYKIIEHDSETSDQHISAVWVEFLNY